MSSAASSSDVGVEIGRHRYRAERHQFAPRHERPGRRTHPTSTSATACRSFAARGRRSIVWRTHRAARRMASRRISVRPRQSGNHIDASRSSACAERKRLIERRWRPEMRPAGATRTGGARRKRRSPASRPRRRPASSPRTNAGVDRLALTSRTSRSNAPSATGAQKLTVSDNGSPDRCGWSISARRIVAAVQPPNGPTKAQ